MSQYGGYNPYQNPGGQTRMPESSNSNYYPSTPSTPQHLPGTPLQFHPRGSTSPSIYYPSPFPGYQHPASAAAPSSPQMMAPIPASFSRKQTSTRQEQDYQSRDRQDRRIAGPTPEHVIMFAPIIEDVNAKNRSPVRRQSSVISPYEMHHSPMHEPRRHLDNHRPLPPPAVTAAYVQSSSVPMAAARAPARATVSRPAPAPVPRPAPAPAPRKQMSGKSLKPSTPYQIPTRRSGRLAAKKT